MDTIPDNKSNKKLKKYCPECGHIHRNGVFCHYYAESPQPDPEDEAAAEEEEEDEDDEEEEDLIGEKVATGPVFAKKETDDKELPTPEFVKRIGWTRCNCQVGVPLHRDYEQVPRIVLVGGITVKQYDDVLAMRVQPPPPLLSPEEEELLEIAKLKVYANKQNVIIPLVMRFLRQGHCGSIPIVSSVSQKCFLTFLEPTFVSRLNFSFSRYFSIRIPI